VKQKISGNPIKKKKKKRKKKIAGTLREKEEDNLGITSSFPKLSITYGALLASHHGEGLYHIA
jgi:hypothetical protein